MNCFGDMKLPPTRLPCRCARSDQQGFDQGTYPDHHQITATACAMMGKPAPVVDEASPSTLMMFLGIGLRGRLTGKNGAVIGSNSFTGSHFVDHALSLGYASTVLAARGIPPVAFAVSIP